ncbi:origin recognition complex subunit 2-domain-containing protein [Kockovaella imperatae]|uniref:Origin recognition complex subunit 2 n=1 Tax=Kockovaella imperatae TaxID=4999 RepID=A0A1Y1U9L4_9TREE|nr:origin recognition complex subunit 2-domain-containing protein [Kockovaella imperatae]ORX34721.1 origin recognition complex subunit 2-domain-containing protein [Kockovaella imperatae]
MASTSRQSTRRLKVNGSSIEDRFEEDGGDEASASHLVSFLTGYDTSRTGRDVDEDEDESEDDRKDGEKSEDEEDDYEDPDEDGEIDLTPSKRNRTGLVGLPSSGRSTPRSNRSTPVKRKQTPMTGGMGGDGVASDEYGYIKTSRADAYFLSHSKSSRTSGNSYSSLVRPLSQATYESHASSARSKGKSKASIESLLAFHALKFDQWELELEEGFNLLLYGYGSKRRLINRFVKDRLAYRGHCVVVNGHFPQLGIRDILNQIDDTLGVSQNIPVPPLATSPLDRSAHRIYSYFLPPEALSSTHGSQYPTADAPLYLVIHNIDSPTLRTPRSLAILSLLACCPRIHLLASFDHIHTPLLFSTTMNDTPPHHYETGSFTGTPSPERGFNWLYHNSTTYDDYDLELTYQRLTSKAALGGISSSSVTGISEEGALQILRSVPPMALRLLKLLLSKQLASLPPEPRFHVAHPASQTSPSFAIDNDILQRLAREKFIAREEERYNALMGEFKDHGMVVEAQADAEGRTGRWVWVPLGKAAIERILETMHETEV